MAFNDTEVAGDLYHAALDLLRQLTDFLQSLSIERADVFTSTAKSVPKSTIGKHVRHVLDHFRILLTEVSNQAGPVQRLEVMQGKRSPSSTSNGNAAAEVESQAIILNYDSRKRDPDVEEDVAGALLAIERIRQSLLRTAASRLPLDTPIALYATIDSKNGADVPLASTLGREIWFVCHHAIHHAALIRAICVEFDIPVSDEFGVAPSTVKHHLEKLYSNRRDGSDSSR
ncbi:hypothetical protein HDU85_007699 [Gaertneriomyces sp. JEL0708]|nr:hypothetical protein HDU85_007699 [Gaertneriomyces sp. JEL0708]